MQKIFTDNVEGNRAQLRHIAYRHKNSYYKKSIEARQAFCSKFDYNKFQSLTLDEYVLGKAPDTFCHYVETGTKKLGSIDVGLSNLSN